MAPMEKLIGLLLWICLFSTAYCQYKPNFSRSYLRREIFILNLEDGYFGCQVNASTDFLQLFELSKLCDGVPQCYLGSDELSSELKCTDRNFCHPKMPRCVNGVCLDNLCYCNDGFGGKGCDLPDENECKYRPCDVFAHCTNTMGSYYCSCFPGYEGDGFTCHDINECEIPELAALCVANAECCNLPGHYVCKCREGYTGNATVACTDVNECSDPQCCGRGATCENVPGSYRCFCPAGFSGNPLEECFDVDECLYNPCGQGALCSNTAGGYVCTCPPGYTGAPTPEAGCVDINECLEPHLYCGSLANCINTQGSFYCECPPGYTGNPKLGCTDINECPHSCGANTDCSNTPGSYVCRCKPGYSGDPYLSSGCTDENECLRPGACGQNAECYNQPGSYECLCKHGYTGNPRQFCSDVNECLQNPCAQYASCENLEGSYQCQCLEGYRGDPDTVCTRAMVKVQCRGNYECTSNAECVNSYCRCKSGFQEVGTECIDVDECSTRNVCGPNARCINSVGTYRCECKKGYEKVRKTLQSPCRDTNECLFGPFPCGKNAKCMNTDGSYECVCPDNLLGDPREACRSPCEGVDCGPHATCEVSGKEAACICDLGFTYDPANIAAGCGDVNECDVIHGPSGLCGQGAVCTNVPGSYHCFCQPGFTGDPFRHCEDINECDRRFGPAGKCAENAICTNTMGSFHCTCPPGYTGNGRYQCQDINECSQSYGPNGKCGISAICTNTPGSFHCRCPPGTQGDPFVRCLAIHACNRDSDCRGNAVCRNGQCLCPAPNYGDDCRHPCDNVFCGDYAKCRLDRNGKAICMCLPGYTGQTNSLPGCRDIDECAQNPCATNAVCRNTPGSYECTCPSQFKGDGYRSCVSEVPTRPLVDCSVEPCRPNEDCIQTPNGRQCVCKRGYIVDSVSKRCRDINECTEYNSQKPPCGSEAFCSNLEGSYVCHCPSNYVGNPYIACYPDGGTCQRDSECPGNTICLREGFAKPHCGCKHPFVRDGAYCILESITCSPTSKCPTNQECILTGSNYGICICPKGYTIEANRFCRDINECEEMKDASLCGVNAKCVNLPGSYDCVCDAGYTGNAREGCKLISYQCQTDDDCPTNQRCNLGACKCFPPYVFQDGVCKHPCDWKQCGQYASCVLVGSEPQCQCNEGFTGNPNTGCWDIDECMLGFPLDPNGPCGSGAICVNTVGSCKCQCPPGTTGDPYKTGCVGSPGCSRNSDCPATTTCETISGLCIDPCMTSICGPNAYCMPQNHHASCVCNVGYTGDPNNLIAGCESPCKNVWCAVNAQCIVNSQNEAICVCMEGFVGNPWAGGGCYPDTGCSQARPCPQNQQCRNGICVEHCKDVDCGIGARCDKKTGQCSCLPFFIGIPEVFCVPPLLPPICIPGCGINAHCTYSVPNKCVCNVGSSGNPYQMCVTSPMPRCDSIRCGSNANCVDGLQRSDCVCPPGLQGNPFLQCDDINECLDHNRCGLNAICINTVGSYTCRCPDQMSGNPFLACTAIPTIPGSGGEFPPVIPTVPGGSTGGGGTSGGETTGSLAPTEPPRLTQCNARIICPPNYICVDGFCRGSLGCNNVTCGQNARCEDSDQSSQCVCLPGYSGNPYDLSVGCSSPCDSIQCGPNAACEVINQRPQCQCKPGFNGDPDDLDNGCPHQSCLHDEDCPAESACYPGYGGQLQCSAPCDGHRCGPNAHCIALSRRPVCTCRTGFYGDASDLTYGCQPYFEACTANSDCAANQVCVPDENRIRNCSDVCKNVRCGHNAHCVGKDHQASCECLPGYERDLVNGGQCYPKQQPACYSDSNCSGDKVCRKTESGSIDCISVCLNYRCGTGAQCVGKNHQPVCKCLPGHAGDPRVHCEKNQCEGNIDCPDNAVCRTNPQGVKECINACEEISCGQNSRCRAFEHIGRCQCLPGFKGNGHDLVIGCVPEDRCNSDSQCKDTEVCYPNQEGVKECQDVCSYTLCGPNSDCIGSNHIAICKCISGYAGNAYSQEVGCLPIPLDKCTHDSDCPSNAVCKATRSGEPKDCINGCDEVRCGPNSKCLTLNHQARCVCVKGFVGDPNDLAQGCQIPHECSEDRNCAHDSVCRPDVDGIRKCALVCLYTQCGVEAYCIGRDHKAECLCRDGYKGNPYDKIKGCEVEFPDKCKHDDECLPSQVCRHSLSSRVLDCINVCDFVQCGPNARCLAENHYGRCECLPGYSGEPDNIINGCRHEPDDECRQNTDCASETQVCKADNSGTRKCVDACQYETCTKPHMKCVAQHHQARCVCEEGYVRDHNDISSCIPIVPDGCTNDSACATYEMCKNGPLGAKKCESPCIDFTCSPNSQCIAIHHKGQCECMEGFIGDPNSRDGCIPLPRHECNADSDCPAHNHVCRLDGDDVRRCIDACLEVHCGPNAICAVVNHVAQCQCPHGLYIGDPSDINKGCQKVECLNDDHCPSNRACADEHYCYDPCINSCGVNAVCIVQNHKAVCRCSADYTGDPYKVGCSLIDPCKTNPCHPSASCIASSGAFTCHCPPSFVGDPYGEGCRHPNSCPRGDEDCADNSACLPDASGINMCKNPCDQTSCGPNAVCQVTNHKASCICQSFFRSYDDDDPIKGCVRIPVNCTADRGCSSNQVCVKNQCRIFCSRDSECAVREKCLNGICVVPCFQHNNCQPGEACILEGYCQIGCRDNNDCDPMMRCIQNRCQNPCDIPKVCGQNALCLVSNHEAQCECIPGFRGTPSATIECQREPLLCSSILPCPPGFKCIGGRCRAPCSECALGEQCVNAACMSQCTSDSNCPTGEICINQICQPGCRTDSDCRLNELCAANQCKCRLGFVMSQSGCEDLNECDEKPCHERAICENVPGSFFCRCREGEIGDGYTHCQEPGECPNGDIDCPPNAACGMDYKNVTKCINPCDEGPCGPQAECTVIEHRSQCACPKIGLFTGKPYDKNIGCISVECLKDSDCPDQKQCINFACQDPCDNVQCEPNGICKVRNHQPYCECNIGYQNNGRLSCVDIDECQQHKCHSTAICENVPGSYACTCPPGLIEKPQGPPGCYDPNVCFNGNKDCPSTATCIQVKGGIPFCKDPCEDPTICGYNAKCHTINHEPVCSCPPNYTGDAKQRCIPVECVEDNNCKSNEVCKDNKCVDACLPPISCGENTLCVAKEHRFTCRCRDSFFGNPELGCRRIFQCTQDVECRAGEMCRDATCFVQCNSNRDCGSNERCHTGRCYLQCRSDGDCPPDFSCSAALCIPNMKDRCLNDEECADSSTCRVTERGLRDCIDPCENHLCGRNAECIARGHTAVCECKQGFVGNPLDEVEGCVKVECYDHNDCNSDRRCNNYKCVDPCQLQNICGSNAFCSAEDHAAVCRCRNGYEGDPLAGCRPIDYCARNPCHPSGICQNTPTGYECYCPPDRNLGNAYTDPGCWAEGECPNGNSDCPLTAVCELDITLKRFLCKDPCQRPNVCGLNAKCRVEDRQPVCYCPESFTGDPRDRVRGCVRVPPICSADPDCPAGLVCEKRRCRPPCQTDADCAQRELCIQGHCVQGCRQDQDCLAGEICVSRNCIPGCRNDNECLNTESCIQNSCKNPCESPTACGANALCEVVNHRQKCECPHFFRGNPTVFCNRDIQACLKTSSCPSNHFCQNGYCRVGCTSDTDCAVGEKCFNEYCVVLCRSDGDCQHNEICISNRCQAGCRTPNQCSDELTCIRNECINPCESSAICGTNAECKVIDHRASCTCPAGFVGRPNANVECIRVSQLCGTASSGQCPSGYLCVKGRCRVTCSSERDCAVNEKCSNGVCHIQCYRDRECAAGEICQQNMCIVGCRSDNECPYDEACIGNQCLNPCGSSTRCGTNAACEVINHQRNCTCPPGLFGDGNSQCWRVSRKCVTQDDCGVGQVCEATRCRVTCSSDNECFDNEKCVDRRCNIICTQDSGCPDGFVCDNGQCLPGCRSDAECPLDKYCINKQCLDPCASPTACGTNAKCLSANHQAYCSCPPDYTGNAKIECRKMECVVDIDCGPGKICQSFRCIEGCRNDQTCPADQSCISRKCVNPCHFTGACGINALCQTISHQTRCSCPSEFTGDPLKECYRMDPDACARDNDCTGGRVCSQGRCKITEECRSDDECPPGHICEGRNCFVGCRNDDNCPFDQACISRRCESPCNIRDVCGINAQCTAFGHQAHCSCPVGFFGNPREECSQLSQCQTDKDCNIKEKCQNQKCIEFHGCASDNDCNRHEICTNNNCQVGCRSNSDCDYSNACINNLCQSPCQPGACGINAECREVNHEASCRCLPDYVGDPKTQCVLDPDICYADTGCKVGHICVSNRCVPGCRTDANCPYEKACVDRRCIDPCSKRYACGIDALCKPQNHQAECVCPPSYGGDPRVQCLPAPPTPLCYHDDDCKAGETCINFACLVKEGCTSDAACPGGHICEQRNCIVGCRRDADCTYDKACINSRCINPCSIQNACGFRAICTPVVHRPQCSCPSGLDGNPYHSCTKVMVRPPLYNCTIDRDCSPGHICRDHVCISGCVSDDHCSPDQMCRNHRCINPCELEGACGINADCSPYNHRPQCTCPSGFSGNPNIHCTLGPDKCIRDEDCGIRMICDKERCIDGCRTDDKCPLTEVCYRRHCQNPCSIPKSCGHNAICRPTNHQPICSCPPTLTGNPKEYCGPGSLVLPCQRDEECTFGQICEQGSCVEGCRRDEHCTPDMVCRNKKCRDPCSVPGVCGRNALCVPITHQAICTCRAGFIGDPRVECITDDGMGRECETDKDCPVKHICENHNCEIGCRNDDHCSFDEGCINRICQNPCTVYGRCGLNALCRPVQHKPECTCPHGYKGNPNTVCHLDGMVECSRDSDCDLGTICENHHCVARCRHDNNCPLNRACVNGQCKNPCLLNSCGRNTFCQPSNHQAICSCFPGYRGNPREGCEVPPGGCKEDADCAISNICENNRCVSGCRNYANCPFTEACINRQCQNPCDIYGACGQNAICKAINHDRECTCPPEYTGNPMFYCHRIPLPPECTTNRECPGGHICQNRRCIDGCQSNDDCPLDQACNRGQCINPCLLSGACGINAICTPAKHQRHCTCLQGYAGDPNVHCTKIGIGSCRHDSECGAGRICVASHCVVGCRAHEECPNNQACVNQLCQNPCTIGGICGVNAQCQAIDHQAVCSCLPMYSGDPAKQCTQVIPECEFNTDCGSGYVCVNNKCSDIDECLQGLGPCGRGAICTNLPGSYKCSCPTDFAGDPYGYGCVPSEPHCYSDDRCKDTEACNLLTGDCYEVCDRPGICGKGARCRARHHRHECYCPDGYAGDPYRECSYGARCNAHSDCPGNLMCLGEHCGCPHPFHQIHYYCILESHNCTTTNPCPENEECVPIDGYGICICPRGFALMANGVCKDMNECEQRPFPCGSRAQCYNTVGSFTCRCPPDTIGDPYRGCEEVPLPFDECRSDGECPHDRACDRSSKRCFDPCPGGRCCAQHATYEMINHQPVCRCLPGYEGNPTEYCYRIKDCRSDYSCPGNLLCLPNGHCGCPAELNRKLDFCIISTSFNCSTNNPCPENQQCIYTGSSIGFCICPRGYRISRGLCIEINECQERDWQPCGTNAICTNIPGSYRCHCPEGSSGDPYKGHCEVIQKPQCKIDSDCPFHLACDISTGQCKDLCRAYTCGRNAVCTMVNHEVVCSCPAGYTGDPHSLCYLDLTCGRHYRCPGNMKCLESNTCGCRPQDHQVGEYCISHEFHNCTTNNPCPVQNELCVYTGPQEGFCVCPHGYEMMHTGLCRDIDECRLSYHPCAPGAKCKNFNGGYNCYCPAGTIGDPYIRGCVEIGDRCTHHENCSHIMECDFKTSQCISPCHKCGPGATCTISSHVARCTCESPKMGDPEDKSMGCIEQPSLEPRTVEPPKELQVMCLADGVQVSVLLGNGFNGVIYVKGYSQDPQCRRIVSSNERETLDFKVLFSTCGLIHVNGEASFILVIQKHPKLVTNQASAYHVKCLYNTGEKTITLGFNVSMITTSGTIANTGPPPTCQMTICTVDGREVGSAEIGDDLLLKVDVQPDYIYGGYARSCVAKTMEDDGEYQYEVTDEDGCATEPNIFGNWEYDPHKKTLTARFNAFKFPSSNNLRFQCNIRVCFGSCPPVNCDGVDAYGRRKKRQAQNTDLALGENFQEGTLREEIMVQSNAILTFDRKESQVAKPTEGPKIEDVDNVCLPKLGLIISLIITTLLALVAVAVAISCWLMAYRRRPKTEGPLPHPPDFPNPLYTTPEPVAEPSPDYYQSSHDRM